MHQREDQREYQRDMWGAKTGATCHKNVTVLKMFALLFALAFALVCFGNDQIVGLIITISRAISSFGLFCACWHIMAYCYVDNFDDFCLIVSL